MGMNKGIANATNSTIALPDSDLTFAVIFWEIFGTFFAVIFWVFFSTIFGAIFRVELSSFIGLKLVPEQQYRRHRLLDHHP